eukprot:933276-Alexandrium_andersonii.AAC.1
MCPGSESQEGRGSGARHVSRAGSSVTGSRRASRGASAASCGRWTLRLLVICLCLLVLAWSRAGSATFCGP